jgi:Alpha amylase, catalytic domain
MTTMPRYPALFQINTRVWLERLSRQAGRAITLADIDDATLDDFAEKGFDWIWLLSVWPIGVACRTVSRSHPQWRAEFKTVLPDLREDDIGGSGFAITAYSVSDLLGGERALAQFREKLAQRGIKLLLDFVPNHTALDHPWVRDHPDYYIWGTEAALAASPQNYIRVETNAGPAVLAYGRDPNFPGWPDTLQLDYANPELQAARIDELMAIAGKCDGVRCDMAMLLLPEIFQRTWGVRPEPFWPKATATVHTMYPAFTFMAEVYWDLEWALQQQGFAYCYDKRLYDRLREGAVRPIRDHLLAGLDYQDKLTRFLENHDEPRAATEFGWAQHQAAAIITFLSPGLRFFHQGQFDGAQIRVPTHLCRGPVEAVNPDIGEFYTRLLQVLKETAAFREGSWSQLQPQPAWEGNWTSDGFVAYAWTGGEGSRYVVVVNYAGNQGQCRLPLPFTEFRGQQVRLTDLMGTEEYDRDGSDLVDNGLFVDHSPWHFNVFDLRMITG